MIHPLAVVEAKAVVAPDIQVWRWSLVRGRSLIGARTKIGSHVVIGERVELGRGCKVEDGAKVYGPVVIRDHVFIGPNVVICNDRHPSAQVYDWEPRDGTAVIESGVSIGAGAVIMPGITLGANAIIGAGAVVLCDVGPGETWVGNPSKRKVPGCEARSGNAETSAPGLGSPETLGHLLDDYTQAREALRDFITEHPDFNWLFAALESR